MAKPKSTPKVVTNRPAYSRMSFLYQAATLLAQTEVDQKLGNYQREGQHGQDRTGEAANHRHSQPPRPLQGMSRRLLTHMRSVSHKTKLRLRPAVKHTVCKFCDTLLVEGETCRSTVENASRGGRKPWADVLVVKCLTCDRERRYPVSAPRQPRRTQRVKTHESASPIDDETMRRQTFEKKQKPK